jgi:hypothetical protein
VRRERRETGLVEERSGEGKHTQRQGVEGVVVVRPVRRVCYTCDDVEDGPQG